MLGSESWLHSKVGIDLLFNRVQLLEILPNRNIEPTVSMCLCDSYDE